MHSWTVSSPPQAGSRSDDVISLWSRDQLLTRVAWRYP